MEFPDSSDRPPFLSSTAANALPVILFYDTVSAVPAVDLHKKSPAVCQAKNRGVEQLSLILVCKKEPLITLGVWRKANAGRYAL